MLQVIFIVVLIIYYTISERKQILLFPFINILYVIYLSLGCRKFNIYCLVVEKQLQKKAG